MTTPPASLPLTAADRSRGRTPEIQAQISATFAPFLEAGIFAPLDFHAVDAATRLAGEHDPEVLLGLALAVRAPRHGHVCAHLPDPQAPGARFPESTVPWPADPGALLAALRASPALAPSPERAAFHLEGSRLYTDRYWRYEATLRAALHQRAHAPAPTLDLPLLRQGLSALFSASPGLQPINRQALACAKALLRPFLVLAGGPGTGKTYSVRAILTLLWAQSQATGQPFRVALAAPTGKAATRMREAILENLDHFLVSAAPALPPGTSPEALRTFLLGLSASTLHRLLGYRPENPTRFRHDAHSPLRYDLLIVDEASMVDLHLLARLFEATPLDCRLLLLGDRDQLASVEAGAVLSDLCAGLSAEVPQFGPQLHADLSHLGFSHLGPPLATSRPIEDQTVLLTESRRFDPNTGIGALAVAARSGDAPKARAVLTQGAFPDLRLLPLEFSRPSPLFDGLGGPEGDRGGLLRVLRHLFAPTPPGEEISAHQRLLETFEEVRVLCALREGPRGVSGLNAQIEKALALREPRFRPYGAFYLGRPILIRENDPANELYNGDIGICVDRPTIQGRLERQVVFPGPTGPRYLAPGRLPPHETVWAMTVHKSQGSQFRHTLLVLPERDNRVLNRELLYTAITRAQKAFSLLLPLPPGDPRPGERGLAELGSLLDAALARRVERASGLADFLWRQP
jgi:exodeoxyribonuclease V alpha subunit